MTDEGRQHHAPRHHGTHRTTTSQPAHKHRPRTTHTTRTKARLPALRTSGTPTFTHSRPQQVSDGPYLPAKQTGSQGRASA